MSHVSPFILVKAALYRHGNTLLSAALAESRRSVVTQQYGATLTRIKADMDLMLMDYLSQQSLKSSTNGFSYSGTIIGHCSLVGRQVELCLSLLTFTREKHDVFL